MTRDSKLHSQFLQLFHMEFTCKKIQSINALQKIEHGSVSGKEKQAYYGATLQLNYDNNKVKDGPMLDFTMS